MNYDNIILAILKGCVKNEGISIMLGKNWVRLNEQKRERATYAVSELPIHRYVCYPANDAIGLPHLSMPRLQTTV